MPPANAKLLTKTSKGSLVQIPLTPRSELSAVELL